MMELARSSGVAVPVVHAVREDALVLELVEGPTLGQRLTRRPWELSHGMRVLADIHRRLHEIPFQDDRLVHFDLHPDNVLLGSRGPVLIDWTNAHGGDPAGDLAMTWLILETSSGLPGRLAARLFLAGVGRDEVRRGLADAAGFRLADPHVTDDERARVRRARP